MFLVKSKLALMYEFSRHPHTRSVACCYCSLSKRHNWQNFNVKLRMSALINYLQCKTYLANRNCIHSKLNFLKQKICTLKNVKFFSRWRGILKNIFTSDDLKSLKPVASLRLWEQREGDLGNIERKKIFHIWSHIFKHMLVPGALQNSLRPSPVWWTKII